MKKIAIIFILLATVGSIWFWQKNKNTANRQEVILPSVNQSEIQQGKRKVFKTQQECEQETGKKCKYEMCDYKCPNDYYYKGWVIAGVGQ